ncbi:MAG: UDP-N-acetylglucosamine 2-epimerase (non-hydrolyzing) [Planctomycetota bacterium]
MKIMTVLGTRPEIIRLSRIMVRLDQLCSHVIVHTGQNYDFRLNGLFFEELGLRAPDHVLEIKGSLAAQWAALFTECERLLLDEQPDRVLILGDTNSGLVAILAKRMGIPVIHLEAGNRCFNDQVPEEVNRRLIDHASDILLPYTEGGRRNLLSEGIPGNRIYVIGNPIFEVITHYERAISASQILFQLGIAPREYFLVTLHRAENVDDVSRLGNFISALDRLQQRYQLPVIVSTHPRTRDKMRNFGIEPRSVQVQFHPPFGFFDFVFLERHARCVLSDSGTVQEECALANVPSVTLRRETERPETLECGCNTLTGDDPESILNGIERCLHERCQNRIPMEYLYPQVSHSVAQIALGYYSQRVV